MAFLACKPLPHVETNRTSTYIHLLSYHLRVKLNWIPTKRHVIIIKTRNMENEGRKKSKYLILHLLKQTIFMANLQCSQIIYDIKRQLVKPDSADDKHFTSSTVKWEKQTLQCIFHVIKSVTCKAFSFIERWCLSVHVMSLSPLYSTIQRLPVSIFSFLLFCLTLEHPST